MPVQQLQHWYAFAYRHASYALASATLLAAVAGPACAQGPQSSVPAFEDPSFRDKLWEAGGPQFRNEKSGKLILSVTIVGNRTVSENKILSHMQSRTDRIFDAEQFNRDLHELYNTDLFRKIEPYFLDTPQGIHLKLKVDENPTVRSIVYHGNKKLDDSLLSKHAGIVKGDPINAASAKQAESRLIDLYRDKGFANADVTLVSGGKQNENDVIFRISEGELERIDDIQFVGNQAFGADLLKTKIKLRDDRRGLTRYMMNVADRTQMYEDQQSLERYYRRLGYFDARVSYHYDYDDSGKWLTLTYVVDEGKQYFLNEIAIRGNQYHTDEELMRAVKIASGEAYNQDKVERDAKFIRNIYGAQGFIFAEIVPSLIYLPDHKVNLVFEITEGSVYRAEDIRIHIEGDNSYTKERVALAMLGKLRPGQIIDAREIESGERRLQFSQIFETNPQLGEPPRIDVLPVDEPNEKAR
ncbi:MAG: POTRA domain-containing protein [Pirellulales bacterium]